MTMRKHAIAALSVLAVMAPGAVFASDIEPDGDAVGPVGNTGAYIELIKLDDSYRNMTEHEQDLYTKSANEFISSGSAYELDRNKLLVQASKIAVQMYLTDDEKRLKDLNAEHDEMWKQLEEFGVGPSHKVHNNTGYYLDKYDQKLREYEEQGHPTQVHTDDVSLSNQAAILFPCYPGAFGIPGTCPIRDLTYGPGTSHVEVWFMAPSGKLTFESKVCLVNTINHNSVSFELNATENANRIWGTNYYSNEASVSVSIHGNSNDCKAISNNIFAYASDNASLDSTLGKQITVSGTHT